MDTIQGKHFSITDPQGVNTVIYRVNETEKEFLKDSPPYTVERLDTSDEFRGELKRRTFYVVEPKEPEQLIILSFGKEKVVVNMGILEGDKLKIAKKRITNGGSGFRKRSVDPERKLKTRISREKIGFCDESRAVSRKKI